MLAAAGEPSRLDSQAGTAHGGDHDGPLLGIRGKGLDRKQTRGIESFTISYSRNHRNDHWRKLKSQGLGSPGSLEVAAFVFPQSDIGGRLPQHPEKSKNLYGRVVKVGP